MNKKTFWKIFDQLQSDIFRLSFTVLQNREEAQDALHDIMEKLWHQRTKIPLPAAHQTAFILRVTKNHCLDKLRARRNTLSISTEENELGTEINHVDLKNLVEVVKMKILELPVQQRMAIELKDVIGHSYEEISEILEVPVPTLRVTVSRARNQIIKFIENERSIIG